jgi:ribosomal-protein-alanine N-acetyltransferase
MSTVPLLRTARTCIRLVQSTDVGKLLQFRIDNAAHFAPWEPHREESYYTLEHAAQTVEQTWEAAQADRGYAFVVLDPNEEAIIASFTFSGVMRGAFQAGLLGYGLAAEWQGAGLMQEVLQAGLGWAFGECRLHRVMANYMPRNERSARLLERLGFEREGYARNYLKIAGHWEDHVLTAKIHDAV